MYITQFTVGLGNSDRTTLVEADSHKTLQMLKGLKFLCQLIKLIFRLTHIIQYIEGVLD